MGRKTKAHWGKLVADWNTKYPVGTAVVLKKDNGQDIATKTRSAAQLSDAGYPVIFLEGVTGYYIMDRVTPMEPVTP